MIQGVVEKIQKMYFGGKAETMGNFYKNWEQSKKAKASLFEILGGEEHSFDVKIGAEEASSLLPQCFSLMRNFCYRAGIDTDDYTLSRIIYENKAPSGQKLSRFILKNKDKINVKSFLPSPYMKREIGYSGFSLDTFLKSFYEKISAMKDEEITISANYIDILSCGHVSGENSCYTQSIFRGDVNNHGQYSLAPHIFAQDDITMMAYVLNESKTKFTKRVFIHVNSERDRFIIGRKYGNWSDMTIKALYRKIEALLGEPDSSLWTKRARVSDYFYDSSVRNLGKGFQFYTGDTASFFFMKKQRVTDYFVVDFPCDVSCIVCGERHQDGDRSGMCYDCNDDVVYGKACSRCGERHHEIFEYDGRLFCERCFRTVPGTVKKCTKCGRTYVGRGHFWGEGCLCDSCHRNMWFKQRHQERVEIPLYFLSEDSILQVVDGSVNIAARDLSRITLQDIRL